MGILGKIKKGIEHAAKEVAGEADKVIDKAVDAVVDAKDAVYDAQKTIIAQAQSEADKIISGAYNEQKNLIDGAKKAAEAIIEDAYKKQKEVLDNVKNDAIKLAASEAFDILIKVLENGNWIMKIVAHVAKPLKDKVVKELLN